MRYAFKHVPVFLIGLILIAVSLTALADGRINVVHHFGGDVLYCADEHGAATSDYDTMLENGGLQLLAMNGAKLLFVPAAIVQEKVAEAQSGGGNLLLAEGQGTHGPAALYVYKMADGTVRFIFVGMDEHGKGNQVDFQTCVPVNPPVSHSSANGDDDTGSDYPTADCIMLAVDGFPPDFYLDFNGSNFLINPLPFTDPDCSNAAAPEGFNYVYAPDGLAVANILCQTKLGSPGVGSGPYGDNIYICQ